MTIPDVTRAQKGHEGRQAVQVSLRSARERKRTTKQQHSPGT